MARGPINAVCVEQQFSRQAAAAMLGISTDKIDELIKLGMDRKPGGIRPVFRIGRQVRIPASSVQRLLASCRIA